jgi:cyclopropane fatty-acyl-phospholipid synthase-like methyltransferase
VNNIETDQEQIDKFYAWAREYWIKASMSARGEKTNILNFGYWPEGTENLYQAQINLFNEIAYLLGELPQTSSGLEIGCGMGGYAVRMAKKFGFTITCRDLLDEHLQLTAEYARQENVSSKIRFHKGSSMEMSDFKESSFDFAYCIESSFHYQDKKRFFNEVFKVVKPGAPFILVDIICRDNRQVRFRDGNYFSDDAEFDALVNQSGFKMVRKTLIGPYVYLPLRKYFKQFYKGHRSTLSRYWDLVLANYASLYEKGIMDYVIYGLIKPSV